MSTEVVKREEAGVAIRLQDLSPEYAEIMVLGKVLQASGYFRDVRDQAQAVTRILFGRELGFSPIVSMGGIHIIEGKPALSSNLMATLIKRSGRYDYRVKTWTESECTLTFREKNGPLGWEDVGESAFTMDDARRAGVVKQGGSWSKYPKAMLFARALSQGLRTYCPDVSAAPIYNPEEMGATVDEEGAVVELPASAKPVEVTTEETPLPFGGPDIPVGTESIVKGAQTAEVSNNGDSTDSSEIPQEGNPVVEYIDITRQKNFHKECRAAVREEKKMDADNLTYKWLGDHGYVDKLKMPTAAMIPAAGWIATRNKAIEWLKKQ